MQQEPEPQALSSPSPLERGREAFRRQRWADAYACLQAAGEEAPLRAEDLHRLAIACHLLGKDHEAIEFWVRAHHAYLDRGEVEHAVRCSFWLGLFLILHGEASQGSGWLARSRRLLQDASPDCVEGGYLLHSEALQTYMGGDAQAAHQLFLQAVEAGRRFQEPDLVALSLIGVGETSIRLGDEARGLALLDETMASLTAGELSPLVVGLVYCAVIASCHQAFDYARAQEWTEAFTRWCDSQPAMMPFRGDCQVYRAAILQLRGAWSQSYEEAARALQRLTDLGGRSWAGTAYYQQAEIHRLRGEFDQAEEAYRLASNWGRSPQPGMALLRLAQGEIGAAVAAIARSLVEAPDQSARSGLLPAYVEALLAAGDVAAARRAADELAAFTSTRHVPFLRALCEQCEGAVTLAEGDASRALSRLRQAWQIWQALDCPYEAARVRVSIAEACRSLGDDEGADLELAAARHTFERLGATQEAQRLLADSGSPPAGAPTSSGLTPRELEVLRQVAAGKTNREIAEALYLSDHTVRRHLQNIFAKLGVSSRSAATAYAFQHDLV
jgi:DNA-binding CsgD family transcriptional regulator